MRKFLLLSGAAIFVLGVPSFASAAPSLVGDSAVAGKSIREIGVRLAQVNNKNTQPRLNPANSPCVIAIRNGQTVSPSRHPNNGFGNCGPDGVPGKSPIADTGLPEGSGSPGR